jgi:hypothetical protein
MVLKLQMETHLCIELVLASPFLTESAPAKRISVFLAWHMTYLLIPLKQYNTSSLVTSRKIITCMIKLDCRDDIRCKISVNEQLQGV